LPIDSVVKIGGGLLAHPEHFTVTLDVVARAAAKQRLVIVAGGGPFADAVRTVDDKMRLSPAAAHWMAILAMDQYGELIADRLPRASVADDPAAVEAALTDSRIPVLTPSRWLRRADPLPHSWDVTSDSIAAWIAGVLVAPRLVLIKPPGSTGNLVDAYFQRALTNGIEVVTIPADQIGKHPDLR
jgi:aspartokinase-like uncharacterized kinase